MDTLFCWTWNAASLVVSALHTSSEFRLMTQTVLEHTTLSTVWAMCFVNTTYSLLLVQVHSVRICMIALL